jgi:hypothetical protein
MLSGNFVANVRPLGVNPRHKALYFRGSDYSVYSTRHGAPDSGTETAQRILTDLASANQGRKVRPGARYSAR